LSNKSFGQINCDDQIPTNGNTCDLEQLISSQPCAIGVPDYGDEVEWFTVENNNNDIEDLLPEFFKEDTWDGSGSEQEGTRGEWHKVNYIMSGRAVPVGWVYGWKTSGDNKWKSRIHVNNYTDFYYTGPNNYTGQEFSAVGKHNIESATWFEFQGVVFYVLQPPHTDYYTSEISVPSYYSSCTYDYIPKYDDIWGYNGITITKQELFGDTFLPEDNPHRTSEGGILRRHNGDNSNQPFDELPSFYYPMYDHTDFYNQGLYGDCGPEFNSTTLTVPYLTGIDGTQYCDNDNGEFEDFKCKDVDGVYESYNTFGTNEIPCAIKGCTTQGNMSYSDKFNVHDESKCSYSGCTDSTASNYNPIATDYLKYNVVVDIAETDGSIVHYGTVVLNDIAGENYAVQSGEPQYNYCEYIGCMDTIGENYNPIANSTTLNDDGLDTNCVYIYGCTDDIAENYDSNATQDDDSCEYTYGCMDEDNCYYNPNATKMMVHV